MSLRPIRSTTENERARRVRQSATDDDAGQKTASFHFSRYSLRAGLSAEGARHMGRAWRARGYGNPLFVLCVALDFARIRRDWELCAGSDCCRVNRCGGRGLVRRMRIAFLAAARSAKSGDRRSFGTTSGDCAGVRASDLKGDSARTTNIHLGLSCARCDP